MYMNSICIIVKEDMLNETLGKKTVLRLDKISMEIFTNSQRSNYDTKQRRGSELAEKLLTKI